MTRPTRRATRRARWWSPLRRPVPATGWPSAALDVVGGVVGLVVVSPVMLIVAISVKADSPGPVLFRQMRLGLGARPFTVLKFRTMHLSADDAATRPTSRSSCAPVGPVTRPSGAPFRPIPGSRASAAFCVGRTSTSFPSS